MQSIASRFARLLVARSAGRNDGLSLAELRRKMERIARFVRPPRSVSVEKREIHGVSCEWITPSEVAARRNGEPRPAVLYLHGGAFCSGSAATHRHLVARIARQAGVEALVPDYRLAPEQPFPAALEDCMACYSHLLDEGFLASRIVIAGDSAGGNLTLAMLIRLRDEGAELPAAGVCLSPVADLSRHDEETKRRDAERAPHDPMIRLHFIAPMIEKYVGSKDPTEPLLSPLFADLCGLPSLLLQAGGDELLLGDAQSLTRQARDAGVDVALEVYPGMWHVWQVFVPYLPEARKAVASVARFISAKSRPSAVRADRTWRN